MSKKRKITEMIFKKSQLKPNNQITKKQDYDAINKHFSNNQIRKTRTFFFFFSLKQGEKKGWEGWIEFLCL